MVRRGLIPTALSARAASSTAMMPVPLSVAPVPRSQLSICPPMITTSSGFSAPVISATVLYTSTWPVLKEFFRSISSSTGPRRTLGRWAPAGRFEEDALLDRHDDAAPGLAASPRPLDHPRLEVGVGQTVLMEPVPGPVVGLVQPRRAGQPRPDQVAEILEVG